MVLARAALLLTALGAPAAPQAGAPQAGAPQPGAPKTGAPSVSVSLVPAAGKTIAPGQSFWVAALFEIEPGWHIYWKNPGDSGTPTFVDLKVPAGYEVERGPLFPAPERIDLPAGMVSYAYEEETALFFRVMVPADAVGGAPIPLALEAEWLVCKEVCFIGSGSDRLELSVGGSAEPREADATALRRARGRLPLPFEGRSSWSVAFHAEEETGKQVGTLRLECPQPVTEFFPDPSGGLRLRSKTVSPREGGGSILELVLETRGDPSEKTARGLLRIRLPDGDGHREINVPVIKETKR